MEEERFITSTRNLTESEVENTLRPTSMDDYVGQEKIKKNLNIYITQSGLICSEFYF